jgi:hypothetical protein
VGNVHTTIRSTLHGSEHAGSARSGPDSNIKVSTEGLALSLLDSLDVKFLSILTGSLRDLLACAIENLAGASHFLNTLVGLVKTQGLQETASQKEAGGVTSRVVLQSDLNAVSGKLLRRGRANNAVMVNLSCNHLATAVSVGDSHHDTVLRSQVLVLVLSDESVATSIVSVAS